jgi:hypothetical protein
MSRIIGKAANKGATIHQNFGGASRIGTLITVPSYFEVAVLVGGQQQIVREIA